MYKIMLGSKDAMRYLGACYEKGTGVKKDLPLAQQWYERAAKEGLPDAMYELGVWYEDGRCGPKDAAQALAWYKKAAEAGHDRARKAVERMEKLV